MGFPVDPFTVIVLYAWGRGRSGSEHFGFLLSGMDPANTVTELLGLSTPRGLP